MIGDRLPEHSWNTTHNRRTWMQFEHPYFYSTNTGWLDGSCFSLTRLLHVIDSNRLLRVE